MTLHPGKLDPALLTELLGQNEIRDERVEIRPGIGRDICAIRQDGRYLVAKTDPITFATDRIGWYTVHVNANDVATAGAEPKWFLVTVLLPENDTDEKLVKDIWNDLRKALEGIDCELCGGHTEVTVGLDRPILVGNMLGEVPADRLVNKNNTRPGDRILMTKGVPVEGTAIMAIEKPERLREEFSEADVERGRRFLDYPGISVLKEAMAACKAGTIHAMHDPTEGGIATGLWELAKATGFGLRVRRERIKLLEPGTMFCRALGLDPLGTISSGTLLMCVPPEDAHSITLEIKKAGENCIDIGEMREAPEGVKLVQDGEEVDMPTYHQDEISRLF